MDGETCPTRQDGCFGSHTGRHRNAELCRRGRAHQEAGPAVLKRRPGERHGRGSRRGPHVTVRGLEPQLWLRQTPPAQQVNTITGERTGYTEWHVQQTGASLGKAIPANAVDRQFFVRVPADYDPNISYRVVYILQGCGAQHAGDKNTYPLFDEEKGGTEEAVYVGVSVPDDNANSGCYGRHLGRRLPGVGGVRRNARVRREHLLRGQQSHLRRRLRRGSGGALADMWGCYFAGNGPPLDSIEQGQAERKFAPQCRCGVTRR